MCSIYAGDRLAPQVGLEQSRLIQPLARTHHHFATSTGKINSCGSSPSALITSSEIAKIARIGISAVQKRYILCSWQRARFSGLSFATSRFRFEFSWSNSFSWKKLRISGKNLLAFLRSKTRD